MKKKNQYKISQWHGKAYNFFGDYLWEKYKSRVLKLPINIELSCPNRDGTVGTGGCIFCSEDGSASPTTYGSQDILNQMDNAVKSFKRSDAETQYIAYFQAYTNTHGKVEFLKETYDAALKFPNVIGLMIGTRPDSLNKEKINLIGSYKEQTKELWLEIGMQSMHESSLTFLNRSHSHEFTRKAIIDAAQEGIKVCVHIILGIPGETWEDMMRTAVEINSLPVSGVKFHHLHVIKNTPLETIHREKNLPLLDLKEYSSIVCDFMERLRGDIIIHRLAGDRDELSLIAPRWGLHKGTVINSIESQFLTRGSYQGFFID